MHLRRQMTPIHRAAARVSEDAILSDFPDLAREDIRAALAFAAARERRLANAVA